MGSTVVSMDSTEYAAAVAAKVEHAMHAAHETQASLAEKTGIPRTTLQRRLTSHGIHPFNVRELRDVAKALGTTAAELTTVYAVAREVAA